MTDKNPFSAHGRATRWWLLLGCALATVLLVIGAFTYANNQQETAVASAPRATNTATPSTSPTARPTPEATRLPEEVTPPPAAPEPSPPPVNTAPEAPVIPPLPPQADPVPLTEDAAPVPGVVFSIGALEPVEGVAMGPGEVGGPALRFPVTVRNDTSETVSLTSTVVNVYAGAEATPATEIGEPGGVPFPETVAPGGTASGVFVFRVPAEERGQIQIAVDYTVGAPIVLFEGPAPT